MLRSVFKLVAKYGIAQGNLFATPENLEGIALWETPEDKWVRGSAAVLGEGICLFKIAGPGVMVKMARYLRQALWLRRKLAPHPHWRLSLLAVEPQAQGRGHAGRLLRPILDYLEAIKISCYLETHNEG